MLRLSRFRGRRGVFGRLEEGAAVIDRWSGGCCTGFGEGERCGWSDDIGATPLPQHREICTYPSGSSSRGRSWAVGAGSGLHFGSSTFQSRGYADEPGGEDSEDIDSDVGGGGRDERETILDIIEKDMSIQDDVAMYLYSKTREMDPKTLLGAMYIKAGFQPPRYSVSSGFKNKFVGTVVVKGKRFNSLPCDTEEEAEKSAADSALSWVLGQPRQGGTPERGRGRGGGMMRGGMRGGRGRGRGRAGGNVKRRGVATRVAIKPRKCFHVEINYKTMSFVVLYDHPQQVYYPYKDFPSQRDLDALARRPGF